MSQGGVRHTMLTKGTGFMYWLLARLSTQEHRVLWSLANASTCMVKNQHFEEENMTG